MTDTQTVGTGTEAPAQPAAEAPTAPDTGYDLNALLKEFEDAKPTQPQPEPAKPATTAVDEEARRQLAELKFEREIQPVLKNVRGDIPKELFSDEELQDWLDAKARRVPVLRQAWLDKAERPSAWAKAEKALAAEFAKKFQKLPDPNATEDVEAVTAAVRGASKTAPPESPPKFGAMTNSEYRKTVKEKYGFDPGI